MSALHLSVVPQVDIARLRAHQETDARELASSLSSHSPRSKHWQSGSILFERSTSPSREVRELGWSHCGRPSSTTKPVLSMPCTPDSNASGHSHLAFGSVVAGLRAAERYSVHSEAQLLFDVVVTTSAVKAKLVTSTVLCLALEPSTTSNLQPQDAFVIGIGRTPFPTESASVQTSRAADRLGKLPESRPAVVLCFQCEVMAWNEGGILFYDSSRSLERKKLSATQTSLHAFVRFHVVIF
nr:hypothetical protein CFP56_63077 [Quercus suber]